MSEPNGSPDPEPQSPLEFEQTTAAAAPDARTPADGGTHAHATPPEDPFATTSAYQAAQRASPWGYVFLLGVLALLTGIAWWRVEDDGSASFVTQAWMFVAVLLMLAPIAWHIVDFVHVVATRRGGAMLAVTATVVLGFFAMGFVTWANVYLNSDEGKRRFEWAEYAMPSFDLTESGRYSLGEETKKILDSVPGTVYATYLERSGANEGIRRMAEEQLKVYGYETRGKVEVRIFDDFRQSQEATEHLRKRGVVSTSSGETHDVIVFSYAEPGREVAVGKQKEVKVDEYDFARQGTTGGSQWLGERVITGAIQELVFTKLKAYAVGGHGERSIGEDMRLLRERLLQQNVEIADRPHEFARSPEVPDDCDLLLILGPQAEFTADEAQAIDRWLEKGRTLFATFDVDATDPRTTGLEGVLKKYGMTPKTGFVVVAPYLKPVMGSGEILVEMRMAPVVALRGDYGSHPAVEPLRRGQGFATGFWNSSYVEVDAEVDGAEVDPVVWAPEHGDMRDVPRPFAARVLPERREFSAPDKDRDVTGQRLPLVVVATRSLASDASGAKRDARVIVSGDTDVFADQLTQQNAPNLDLFGGLVQWGLRRESLVSVSERTLDQEWVNVGPREHRMAFWWPLVTALAALLAGAAVWWGRRR